MTVRWSGYSGRTINTLRLWAAGATDSFDFQEFSHGDFVGAMTEKLAAESITRVLYPDDSTTMGQELRFLQEYFLSACSVQDVVRRFRDVTLTGICSPTKPPSSSTTRTPRFRSPN